MTVACLSALVFPSYVLLQEDFLQAHTHSHVHTKCSDGSLDLSISSLEIRFSDQYAVWMDLLPLQ